MSSRIKQLCTDLLFTGSKLRAKLFYTIIFASLSPFAVLAVLALYTITLSHRHDVARIEDTVLFQKSTEIQSFVDATLDIFQLAVPDPVQRIAWRGPDGESSCLPDGEKSFEYQLCKNHLDLVLDGIIKENLSIENAVIIDASRVGSATDVYGSVVAARSRDDVPPPLFDSFARLESFQRASKGERFVSDVYYTLRGPMVTVASPIRNGLDEIIGVIAGQLNLSSVRKIVGQTRLGETGYVYLVDGRGRLITSSKNAEAGGFLNLSPITTVQESIAAENRTTAIGQKRYRSHWGEDVVGGGKKLERVNLALIAEWPRSDADKILLSIRNQFILFSAITAFLVLVISIFLSQRIVRPIRSLEAGARRVSTGDFEKPVLTSTGDEIDELSGAFNEMMIGLKEYQSLKDQFVFIAAHELRAPITAMKGYLSMIGEETADIPEKIRNYLHTVEQSNARLVSLINDLLEVARSEAGRMSIDISNFDPEDIIRASVEELKPLADEKKIVIAYDGSGKTHIRADEARYRQIIVNLISNAIKYTLGEGTISVWHEKKDDVLVTHIRDTGMGIPKEKQAHMFEKFYRVKDERTRSVTGTGLGLYIVKMIVEKMGGKIWFESEESRGTTFSFSVPSSEK